MAQTKLTIYSKSYPSFAGNDVQRVPEKKVSGASCDKLLARANKLPERLVLNNQHQHPEQEFAEETAACQLNESAILHQNLIEGRLQEENQEKSSNSEHDFSPLDDRSYFYIRSAESKQQGSAA